MPFCQYGSSITVSKSTYLILLALFMLALFGTGLLCLVLAVSALASWEQLPGKITLIASAVYVVGCVGVTMFCNMPLNNALAAAQIGTPEATSLWSRYFSDWTMWNHVRTAASVLSSISFTPL